MTEQEHSVANHYDPDGRSHVPSTQLFDGGSKVRPDLSTESSLNIDADQSMEKGLASSCQNATTSDLSERSAPKATGTVIPDKSSEPYTAFPPWRQGIILGLVTAAGFLGPLAGGIYLPALPVLEQEFGTSPTAINATVSVFMVVFAIGVCFHKNSSQAPQKPKTPCRCCRSGRVKLSALLKTTVNFTTGEHMLMDPTAPRMVFGSRLQRQTTALLAFHRDIHSRKPSPRYRSHQLRGAGRSSRRAGLWLGSRGRHGRGHRSGHCVPQEEGDGHVVFSARSSVRAHSRAGTWRLIDGGGTLEMDFWVSG